MLAASTYAEVCQQVLSDLIAERVVALRKAVGITREEFAERCQQVGGKDITVAALANIETGRRNAEGERRRKVAADELAVFAVVLGVPLVWLMADPQSGEPAPLVGDTEVDPWRALAWMIGAMPLDGLVHPAWEGASPWLRQLADLYRQIESYDQIMRLYDPRYHPQAPVGMSEDASRRNGLKAIRDRLEGFWRSGMPLPPLPPRIRAGLGELVLEKVNAGIENTMARMEVRASGVTLPPGEDRTLQAGAFDSADSDLLTELAVNLQRVQYWGLTLPAIPDVVVDRAKELGIALPTGHTDTPGAVRLGGPDGSLVIEPAPQQDE